MLLIFIPYVLFRWIIEFSFHWGIGGNLYINAKSCIEFAYSIGRLGQEEMRHSKILIIIDIYHGTHQRKPWFWCG